MFSATVFVWIWAARFLNKLLLLIIRSGFSKSFIPSLFVWIIGFVSYFGTISSCRIAHIHIKHTVFHAGINVNLRSFEMFCNISRYSYFLHSQFCCCCNQAQYPWSGGGVCALCVCAANGSKMFLCSLSKIKGIVKGMIHRRFIIAARLFGALCRRAYDRYNDADYNKNYKPFHIRFLLARFGFCRAGNGITHVGIRYHVFHAVIIQYAQMPVFQSLRHGKGKQQLRLQPPWPAFPVPRLSFPALWQQP